MVMYLELKFDMQALQTLMSVRKYLQVGEPGSVDGDVKFLRLTEQLSLVPIKDIAVVKLEGVFLEEDFSRLSMDWPVEEGDSRWKLFCL